MLDETVPVPDHTALAEARESLRWNGSLWDAILTYHRVADEQAAKKSLEQVTFEGMNAKNGEVSMRFGTSGPDGERVLQAMAEALADTLDGCGAENYAEMQVYHRGKDKEFLLTVQRLEKPTPHDKRLEAEKTARKLAEALRLTVEYVGTATLPALPGWSWYDALAEHFPAMAEELSKPQYRGMPFHRFPKPATTEAELDGLPPFAMVQGYDGFRHVKLRNGRWQLILDETTNSHGPHEIALPATILHTPDRALKGEQ